MDPKLRGIYTALVTPFSSTGEIDWKSLDRLLSFQLNASVSGLVVCGTTGETPTLSLDEKKTLTERVLEKAKETSEVIVGTGSNSTKSTLEMSTWAKEKGADALLVVVPYYNKPTQSGLYAHFVEVAKAVSPLPIILYDVPGRTGVSLSLETIFKLGSECPNIVGIKDATGSVTRITEIRALLGEHFSILSGDDPIYFPSACLGANGVISVASNVAPKEMVAIHNALTLNHYQEARALHNQLFPLFRDLFIESNPTPCKWILTYIGVIESETVRKPLAPLSAENQIQLKITLEKTLGITK